MPKLTSAISPAYAYLGNPKYTPEKLLDAVQTHLNFKNYSQMATQLGINYATVYKIRSKDLPITANVMLRIIEATGWTTSHIRQLAGLLDNPTK